MSNTIAADAVRNWTTNTEIINRLNYSNLHKLYIQGSIPERESIVLQIESVLKTTTIDFNLILGDESGSIGFDEFDTIVGDIANSEQNAREIGLHVDNSSFRSSISKYSGLTARNNVSSWKGSVVLGQVLKRAPNVYTFQDNGIKSIFMAMGLIYPTLVNSLLLFGSLSHDVDTFMNLQESSTTRESILVKIFDNTTTDDDALDEISSALTLFGHKFLENARDVESTDAFDDSRFYVIDMILNLFSVGVYINGTRIGSKDNVSSGSVELDKNSSTWTVKVPSIVPVRKHSFERFYDNVLVGSMLREYDTTGVFAPLDMNTRVFWERVLRSGFGVGVSATDLVYKIKMHI